MKQKQEVMSTPDKFVDPQEGFSSASARKMDFFGITLDSIQSERKETKRPSMKRRTVFSLYNYLP